MAILPRVRITFEGTRRRVRASRNAAIAPEEAKRLAHLDTAKDRFPPGDRSLTLGSSRWAVGRGSPEGTTWRIVPRSALGSAPHVGWMWGQNHWFDQSSQPVRSRPQPLLLRAILPRALPVTPTYESLARLLGGAIAGIRRGDPVAIAVPTSVLLHPRNPTRWFLLALLGSMPRIIGQDLRLSSRESEPRAEDWDVVFTDQPRPGFRFLTPNMAEVDDEPVARFVTSRLLEDAPEAVEAVAAQTDPDCEDPWLAGLKRYMVEAPDLVPSMEAEGDQLVRGIVLRIRSGLSGDSKFASKIAEVATSTQDTRIWRELASRPDEERAEPFIRWLDSATVEGLTAPQIRALDRVRPPGTGATKWAELVAQWVVDSGDFGAGISILERALLDDTTDRKVRANAWMQLITGLGQAGRNREAVACLDSTVSAKISADVGCRALTHPWLQLSRRGRTTESLDRLLELAMTAPDGQSAAAQLYTGLKDSSPALTQQLLEVWGAYCAKNRQRPPKAMRSLEDSQHQAWMQGVLSIDPMPEVVIALMSAVGHEPTDGQAWSTIEGVWSETNAAELRQRLIWLAGIATAGAPGAEVPARQRLVDLLEDLDFPDRELAMVAAALAGIETASPVWMWTAATAAVPGQFDDGTTDATVIAFCHEPVSGMAEQRAAELCAERLGESPSWDPVDQARWVVRLATVPQEPPQARLLGRHLMMGAAMRRDGPTRVAAITNAMLGLPPDHMALTQYLEGLLPAAWPNGAPQTCVEAIRLGAVDQQLRQQVLGALGR